MEEALIKSIIIVSGPSVNNLINLRVNNNAGKTALLIPSDGGTVQIRNGVATEIKKQTYGQNAVTYKAVDIDKNPLLLNNMDSITLTPAITKEGPFSLVISRQKVATGEFINAI